MREGRGRNSLICSDGMARGLDIDVIANVVSYDAPTRVQTYIHRVGRTARAGRPGSAYTILTGREVGIGAGQRGPRAADWWEYAARRGRSGLPGAPA